jgi:hypothetical protein
MEKDIKEKIFRDFGGNHLIAIGLLKAFETESGLSPRVSRCIVHLAKGDLGKLETYIQSAKYDWRDVIYWAESVALEYNRPFKNE